MKRGTKNKKGKTHSTYISLLKISLIFFIISLCNNVSSQDLYNKNKIENSYINASFKFVADFGLTGFVSWRASFSTAIANKIDFLTPALQIEFQIYQKGLGNEFPAHLRGNKINFDFTGTWAFTFGCDENEHYKNLYVFNTSASSSFIQLYNKSITFGSNYNRLLFRKVEGMLRNQKIGFLNININKVQILYYNDGPPFDSFYLGDAYDRWWTGGGLIQVESKNREYYYTVSYDKFTGFTKHAYEIANNLHMDYVSYPEMSIEQRKYNIGQTRFQIINNKKNLGTSLTFVNSSGGLDFQNLIHYFQNYTFHPMASDRYIYVGASYQNLNIYKDE